MRAAALCVGLAVISATTVRAVEYDAGDLRDPFSSLTASKSKTQEVAPLKLPVMEGVLWNAQPPQAILSGKVVRAGSIVDGVEVVKIEKRGVTVRINGQEHLLTRKGGVSS